MHLPKNVSPNCALAVLTAATSQLFQLLWCWQSSGSEGWVQQGGYIPTTAMDDYWKVKMNHSPTPNLTLLVLLLFTTLVVGEDSEILPLEFPANGWKTCLILKSEHMYLLSNYHK